MSHRSARARLALRIGGAGAAVVIAIGAALAPGLIIESVLKVPLPSVWKEAQERWAHRYPSVFRPLDPLASAYVNLFDRSLPGISPPVSPLAVSWGADPGRELGPPSYTAEGRPLSLDRRGQGEVAESPLRSRVVETSRDLLAALSAARAGDEILISPGVYRVSQHAISVRGQGSRRHPIVVRAKRLGEVRIELDTLEGFYVPQPFWVFENLDIAGVCQLDANCEHAFHVVGRAHSTAIRNNRIHDFNAAIKVNSLRSSGGVSFYPDNGLLEGNSLFNEAPRASSLPATIVDIVAADHWTVDGNLIADSVKGGGDRTSYGAFIKGNATGGTIERNLVVCALGIPPDGGTRIGLSLGGGGTGAAFCRNGDCSVESRDAVIRNNVIMHCSDVGIYLNRAHGAKVVNNTVIATRGIDARFPETRALIANNVFTGRLADRDGGFSFRRDNINAGRGQRFLDVSNGDLSLVSAKDKIINGGLAYEEVQDDFCGSARPSAGVDVGAFEYVGLEPGCQPLGAIVQLRQRASDR